MREVAVHLEDELGSVVKRPPEPGDVRRTEAFLDRAMEDGYVRKLGGESIGDLAGPVGRSIVDDEHTPAVWEHLAESAHHRLDVLSLVVGR